MGIGFIPELFMMKIIEIIIEMIPVLLVIVDLIKMKVDN